MTLSPEFEAITYSAPSDSSLVSLEQIPYETKRMVVTLVEMPYGVDYCAFYDGEEEAGGYGYGPTPEAAIEDYLSRWD